MRLKRILSIIFITSIPSLIFAADTINITGEWDSMDEKTGYKMVHVKITESAPNLYQGYIIQAFNPPNHPNQDLSALKGFYLLHDLKQDPNDPYKLISGYIINPFVKKSKKVSIHGKLIKYGNTMILRNSSDPDQSSRSVTWVRKK